MLNLTSYNFGKTIGYSRANYPVDDSNEIQLQIILS
jgi:hypothetical protein